MGVTSKTVYIAMIAVGVYCLKQYMNGGVCNSRARIDGKVVVVTGANTGIGKVTAEDLALRGGKIYMACRSVERGTNAREDILKENPKLKKDNLIVLKMDLGSTKSIRSFVNDFKKAEKKLDILISNAGVMFQPEGRKTEDGFENTFGVNHLGHFLLTNLLMDEIVSAAPSRVVTVSSRAENRGVIHLDDPMLTREYSMHAAYGQSKLANILFSKELGERLKGTGVTTYSLHPGAILTELAREINFPVVGEVLKILLWPFVKDLKQGAETQICCAVAEELVNETGKYYADCEEREPGAADAHDPTMPGKLWDLSMKLLELDNKDIHPKLRG